jgi:hypothetical protein
LVAHCPPDLRHNHCGVVALIPSWLQALSTYRREEPLINEHRSQIDEPQIDEAVWNAWVQKNAAKDKIRSARRKKILGFVAILGVILVLFWRWTT